MPKLLLFCVLFFLVFTSWSADFPRRIRWSQEDQVALKDTVVAGFEGSIVVDKTSLPYWFECFELTSAGAEVAISDAVYEPVNLPASKSKFVTECQLSHRAEIGNSAGKSFLRLTVFPFVRQNNQVLRLVGFTVSVNENPMKIKSASAAYQWKSSSVLASGKWIRIKTSGKGIYKITYDQLKQWGFTSPDQVAAYGNGGLMLPVSNNSIQNDDLNAYPVWKGKDNTGKDCLFFYSTGNVGLTKDSDAGSYSHQQNFYSTATYFYLTDHGSIRTIDKVAEVSGNASRQVALFPNYAFYEKEAVNLTLSGTRWFGEQFSYGGSQTINLTLENPNLNKPVQFRIVSAARSSASSSMSVAVNGKSENSISFQPINIGDPEDIYADLETTAFSESVASKNVQIKLTYNAANSSSNAWLDYIAINYQSILYMSSDVYSFRGIGSEGQFPVSEFVVSGASSSTRIFDVTDINNTFEMPTTFADSQLKFKSNSASMREYVAFNPAGSIPEPELVETVANQNLHAADLSEMIIVSNSALLSAANELATYHRESDQMTVQVVTPEVIFNEFSGGLPDPSGLRNYFRMCYERGKQSGKNTLKYILLMGDGSYDNRNLLGLSHNLLPTFQSDNSLLPTESFVTDDFFVFLDENEGGASGTVDLGIGRIPARTLDEAETVVDKIKKYRQQKSMGNWRNMVTFIADDENDNIHMEQAEDLADFVNKTHPAFYTNKIYFDAYKQISTSGGEKYPEVNEAINGIVKQGTLILNYTGHANEKFLADEQVLNISGINSWTNYYRLPVFVTATCEFSRFDADETSAGEEILFNSKGGGVGLFSTTRLVYSGANYILNREFFRHIFEKDQSGNNLRLGDVMRLAKAAANTGINQLNFTLLADPAIRLANPELQVKTTSVNGKDVETTTATISPLSVVTIKGYVADDNGVKLSSFNGEIIPTVYDKAIQTETLGNGGQEPFSYSVQSNIIYKGLTTVKNGEFEFTFFVPKDVSYKLDKGKILYYAYNESVDAQGYFDNFYVGGSSGSVTSDSQGPEIELFLNSHSFKDGGTVSASSVLLANVSDQTGINTSGTGIGHDITAILDDDETNIMVLNDYFQADKDSYTSGKIVFPLTDLAEGKHKLKLKVWDVLNNSSEQEITFVVKDDFRIESVSCYPNPMQGETSFLFTHNQPDETFDVTLEVFQVNGVRIDMVQTTIGSDGTASLPLQWVPAERSVKMAPGIYIYRLTVTTSEGKQTSGAGRLVFVYR